MNALAGLMNPAQLGQGVQQAFQEGRAMAKQQQQQNALAAYAMNPNDPQAFNGLAQHAPEFAIKIGADRQKQQMEARRGELIMRASQGDARARLELWGVDSDTAMKLDDRQAKEADDGFKYVASAAYQIAPLGTPEEKAQAWDAAIDRGVQMGFDGLAQYRGQYSEQNLNAMLSKAGEMEKYQKYIQPDYKADQGYGMKGYQFGVPIGGVAAQAAPDTLPADFDFGGPTQPVSGGF